MNETRATATRRPVGSSAKCSRLRKRWFVRPLSALRISRLEDRLAPTAFDGFEPPATGAAGAAGATGAAGAAATVSGPTPLSVPSLAARVPGLPATSVKPARVVGTLPPVNFGLALTSRVPLAPENML